MHHLPAINLSKFPKDIGDKVLCMEEGVLNILIGIRYVVIHTPDIITREIGHGGYYWVMTEENFGKCNFLRGNVPMHKVRPTDIEDPDNFSWVGGTNKVCEIYKYPWKEDRAYP